MRQIWVFVTVAALARTAIAEDKLDVDQDRWKAIGYLWGSYVTYTRNEAKGVWEIALKAGTTQDDVQRWVRDYYAPTLTKWAHQWADFDGERQVTTDNFSKIGDTANGWVFSEPVKRRSFC